MKILHTADLHLGRTLAGHSLERDCQKVLDQLITAVKEHQPQVLIIAGDIFDRQTVAQSVVAQFNKFVRKLANETKTALVMIAGNHDARERIEAMGLWPDQERVLVRGTANADEKPLILEDEFGPVAFSGLPYLDEYSAREIFQDQSISSPEDILRKQFEAARLNVPENARWVVVAHTFVSGAQTTEIEQPLSRVGGIDHVPGEIFEDANYVALGHLHKPQNMFKETIRYSGAPLALGFDEAGSRKSFTLVDIEANGDIEIQEIPVTPLRDLKVVRGSFAEILANLKKSEDFYKIILTDSEYQIDPAKRLREIVPNFCSLEYERDKPQVDGNNDIYDFGAELPEPIEVIRAFIEQVRVEKVKKSEDKLIQKYLLSLNGKEELI